jgi:hypothetical protein
VIKVAICGTTAHGIYIRARGGERKGFVIAQSMTAVYGDARVFFHIAGPGTLLTRSRIGHCGSYGILMPLTHVPFSSSELVYA